MSPSGKTWGLLAALALTAPVLLGVIYTGLAALGVAGPGAEGEPSLQRVGDVLGEAAVLRGTLWILWIALASTVLSFALATVIATALRGTRGLDRLGRWMAILPLPVPHLVAGVAGLLVLGQSGLFARIAFHMGFIAGPGDMPALVYDPVGIGLILSLMWKETPFLTLVAVSVLATRGSALERTARGLGASPGQVLVRVTWPMLWRGTLPAAVAVFTFVAGSYEAAVLLAPSRPLPLPVLTWERFVNVPLAQRGDAYVLAWVGMALAALAVAVHEWVRARLPGVDGGQV